MSNWEEIARASAKWHKDAIVVIPDDCVIDPQYLGSMTNQEYIDVERLKTREREKFGSRIDIGGDMYDNHVEFINWAASYDDGGMDMRSKVKHDDWQKQLMCPLILVDGSMPLIINFELVKRAMEM